MRTLTDSEKADIERDALALWQTVEGKRLGRKWLLSEKGKGSEGDMRGGLNLILDAVKTTALKLYDSPPPKGY